ncbi:MAG TPA: hypothetical protein VF177_02865 [Anaerolineae bacterium]
MKTFTIEVPAANHQRMAESYAETTDSRWKGLYKVAGVAALITVAFIPIAIVANIVWPPPAWSAGAARDWFTLFADNWFLGLVHLDLLLMMSLVLSVPIFLALYVALRPAGESAMVIATAIALIGVVLHLTSNTAFEMYSLSNGYAAAATDAQRALFLAAGEATLAAYYGTAFHVSYILGYIAKIIIGVVMLRSAVFSKTTAYLAMLIGVVGFGFYLPTIGMFLSILAVLFIAIWHVLIARTFFRLGRADWRDVP